MKQIYFIFLTLILLFPSCNRVDKPPILAEVNVSSVTINNLPAVNMGTIYNIPNEGVTVSILFSGKINKDKLNKEWIYFSNEIIDSYEMVSDVNPNSITLRITKPLTKETKYFLRVVNVENLGVKISEPYITYFLTELDTTPKFPKITDEELLTKVQRESFKFFWDYGHPVSGLARERSGSGETVTIGGSGFGVMAILVGIERGFITRTQGFERLNKIVDFLSRPETDKYHGVFPHWMNGTTGKVIPFSTKDNGADLIETAFLFQGLLTVQSYFKNGSESELTLCNKIKTLWEKVEWSWFQKNGEARLYWHWSPNHNWDMNMSISGWNEGLIAYVLAASSPTYSIPVSAYESGWARGGAMKNGKKFYDITLPLGEDRGGPLFFAHYSFLGLNPTRLSDKYANYMEQNRAHAKINYSYCVANPLGYFGYGKECWGLSASDIPNGYTASSPNRDGGTITPTAALSSFPYTPTESMGALHFFYYIIGDKLWGEYGFKDSFNLSQMWFANSYLAIDQGPIIIMIENYRSGLLWKHFMEHPDIIKGLNTLGFSTN